MGQALSGEVSPDGTFHIRGVAGGRFTLHIDPLPENAYISKLLLDGNAVSGNKLELSRNSRIKATVSPNGGQISGALLDQEGGKLTGTLAVFFLVNSPVKAELDGSEDSARVGPDGTYSFHAIRPGKYRLITIDMFHFYDIQKPEIFQKLAAAAEEFEIKAGDRITKDIRVAEQEGTNAKPKQ
jgi:hypothetical protein